ncbi:MAG: PA14 domain-containing protein, partial [Desulfobacterales bacterium]|nr:PA14 domain-containing protein [Desulfobacterales bacterium]
QIIPAGEMAPLTGPVEVAGISMVNASFNDWSKPVTLKATGVKGMAPYMIQWYKNDQPIENANGYSVVAAPENGAVYKFVISNLFSRAEAAYTLTLANDATQLAVVGVAPSPRFDGVTLTFNKPVDLATAYNPANYQLTGLDFLGITVRSDRTNVFLATSLQAESGNYSVMVSGVKDAGAEPTTIVTTNLAFQAHFLVQGYIRTEHYNETVSYLVQGNPAYGLFVNQKFIDNKPDKTAVSTNFYYTSSPAQDLYGARMYGWFVPPASGNWTFYERADDSSVLYLNPMGTDPAGKVVVARSEAAGQNYTNVNTGNPRYSAVTLAAGSRYYIEGVFQEGTGGDYMSAAVRAPNDLSVPLDGEYARGDFFMMSVPAERRTDIYVLRNPTGGNIQEGQTFTLNGLASAFDLSLATTYVWQQETAYGSGVFTNLTDATGNYYAIGTNYTTRQLYGVNTTNRYRVAVYSPSGKAYSAVAEVAVIAPDTTPPAILGAVSPLARTSVTVMFSEVVSAATANVLANYRLTDGVSDLPISGVALQADGKSVVLTLGTTLMPGNPYTVVVNHVQDTAAAQNMIAADAAYQFWAPQGFFMRKAYGYASGLPASISALTNDARWLNDQYTFIHAITTPDVPTSSPDTNNFATRMQGYLIPDRTGNFTFYIATDDHSELWLSTDNNPANVQLICYEQNHGGAVRNWTGAGNGRTISPETGDYFNVSRTLFLQAGKAYFFELKHREGTGGDYQGFNW